MFPAKTNEDKAKILKNENHKNGEFYEELEFLSCHNEIKIKISKMIKITLIIIGLHLSLSSVVLWIVPNIYKISGVIQIVNWIFIFWFIFGIASAVYVVWILIVRNGELKLKDVNPKLYKLVHENN